jgi:hypothetical protein
MESRCRWGPMVKVEDDGDEDEDDDDVDDEKDKDDEDDEEEGWSSRANATRLGCLGCPPDGTAGGAIKG